MSDITEHYWVAILIVSICLFFSATYKASQDKIRQEIYKDCSEKKEFHIKGYDGVYSCIRLM